MKNLITFSTILFYSLNISAQGKTEPYWLSLGLGLGGGKSSTLNTSIGANFSLSKQKHLFSIRCLYNKEVSFLGESLPAITCWDAGLLYGRYLHGKRWAASISSGIACSGVVQRGKYLYSNGGWFGTSYYEKKKFITVGLPIEGQLFWTPSSQVGFGLIGFVNFNSRESFGGGLICLHLGIFDYP